MLTAGDHLRSIDSGGRTRTYLLHIPAGYDPSRPAPVVLAFHGLGTNARTMVRFCGLNETAKREGFLVIYPNGTGENPNVLTWNAGNCCAYAMAHNVDDVGFTRAILDDLASIANVDLDRVFATGMSNGGMMVYRLACELADRIAAIAPVSGPLVTNDCRPGRPVSVMHFHGTEDEFAPFGGGRGPRSFTESNFRSVESSVRFWVRANGCPEEGVEVALPSAKHDGTSITKTTWGPGREGSEVVLYAIRGGGHTWPGRVWPLQPLGLSTTEISANELMWEFFQKHPLERPPSPPASA